MNTSYERQGRLSKTIAVLAALTLFILYAEFLGQAFANSVFASWGPIEALIFYTLLIRVLALLFIPSLKKLQASLKIVIVSLEDFVLCFLILLFILTGAQIYSSTLSVLLTSWIGASIVILIPYSILELGRIMYAGTSLLALVVSSAPLLSMGLFVATLGGNMGSQGGLSNLGASIIGYLKDQQDLGNGIRAGSDPIPIGAAIFFSVCLLVYIAMSMNQSITKMAGVPKYHYALALVLVGIVTAYLWTASTLQLFSGDLFEIFTLPAILIPVVLWVLSRIA